jgi:hypothetical protein
MDAVCTFGDVENPWNIHAEDLLMGPLSDANSSASRASNWTYPL